MIFIAKDIEDSSCSNSPKRFKDNTLEYRQDLEIFQKVRNCSKECDLVDGCIYFKFFEKNYDSFGEAIHDINRIAEICTLFR